MGLRATTTSTLAVSGSATITRLNTSAELVAPCFIEVGVSSISGMDVTEDVSATWVYDPTFHEIDWLWTVDGGTDQQFTNANLRLPTYKKNHNRARGKKAVFFFDTPGTYTVQVLGIDRTGNIIDESTTYTVRDPATEYPTTRTICVDPSGTYTGAPSGSQQFTSIAAARAAMNALGATTHRLMLARGQTFNENLNLDDSIQNCRISAFGTGANPIWTLPSVTQDTAISFGSGNLVSDFMIAGIDFVGPWDAATQSGFPDFTPFFTATHNTATSPSMGALKCNFDGCQSVRSSSNEPDTVFMVGDSYITNWQDYGSFQQSFEGATSRVYFRGCAVQQDPDACVNNNNRTTYIQNNHGPFRGADAFGQYFQQCDLFSANSHAAGIQPALRTSQAGSSSEPNYGMQNLVMDCILESGGLSCQPEDSGSDSILGNFLFDGNLFLGGHAETYAATIRHGGATFRNNLCIQPGIKNITSFIVMSILNDGDVQGNSPINASAGIFDAYSNTFMDLNSSGHASVAIGQGDWTNEEFANNLEYQPNGGTSSHTNITQTTVLGITPLNRGKRTGPNPTQTSIASTADGATVDIALPSGMVDADFDAGDDHVIRLGSSSGQAYSVDTGGFTVTKLGNGNVRITNTSGTTWSGTLYMGLKPNAAATADNAKYGTDTSLASPTTIYLPIPASNSSAKGAATGVLRNLWDYQLATRKGPSETGNDLDGNPRTNAADDVGALLAL